jgi:hypothetical protein
MDSNIAFQLNLAERRLKIVVLRARRLADTISLTPKILQTLPRAPTPVSRQGKAPARVLIDG